MKIKVIEIVLLALSTLFAILFFASNWIKIEKYLEILFLTLFVFNITIYNIVRYKRQKIKETIVKGLDIEK